MDQAARLTLDREEWLRRFRKHLALRYPGFTAEMLAEYTEDAYEALSSDYPSDPEKAVDDEEFDWKS